MKVSVSIVCHRSRAWIDACLASVRAQEAALAEILVVENDSRDGTVEHLHRHHPDVDCIASERNLGYAAGHNLNFARSRGDAFLVLNPDVVLRPGYIARLVESFERDPGLGAAGGRLLRADGSGRLDSAGITRSPLRLRFVDRGRGQRPESHACERDVFGVCGAAALYRREALEQVSRPGESPFAERLFMYYEDVDLAWRLARAGWRSRFIPAAGAEHARGGSEAPAAFVEYHLVRNRAWVALRNAGLLELALELPALFVFDAAKGLQALGRPHLRRALRDQWRGLPACWRERRAARQGR